MTLKIPSNFSLNSSLQLNLAFLAKLFQIIFNSQICYRHTPLDTLSFTLLSQSSGDLEPCVLLPLREYLKDKKSCQVTRTKHREVLLVLALPPSP